MLFRPFRSGRRQKRSLVMLRSTSGDQLRRQEHGVQQLHGLAVAKRLPIIPLRNNQRQEILDWSTGGDGGVHALSRVRLGRPGTGQGTSGRNARTPADGWSSTPCRTDPPKSSAYDAAVECMLRRGGPDHDREMVVLISRTLAVPQLVARSCRKQGVPFFRLRRTNAITGGYCAWTNLVAMFCPPATQGVPEPLQASTPRR